MTESTRVTVIVPIDLLEDFDKLVDINNYQDRSEYVRRLLRKEVEAHEDILNDTTNKEDGNSA